LTNGMLTAATLTVYALEKPSLDFRRFSPMVNVLYIPANSVHGEMCRVSCDVCDQVSTSIRRASEKKKNLLCTAATLAVYALEKPSLDFRRLSPMVNVL